MTIKKLSDFPSIELEINRNKRVIAASKITLKWPLREVPSEYWNKVEVGINDWYKEYLDATHDRTYNDSGSREIPMMESYRTLNAWDRKFRSQKDLDNFKKYLGDSSEERLFHYMNKANLPGPKLKDIKLSDWLYINAPFLLTSTLERDGKFIVSDVFRGVVKAKNKEAFEYLKSIVRASDIKAKVNFLAGEEFALGEWLEYKLDNNEDKEDKIELTEQNLSEIVKTKKIDEHILLPKKIYIRSTDDKFLTRKNGNLYAFSESDHKKESIFYVTSSKNDKDIKLGKNEIALQGDDGRWLVYRQTDGKYQVQAVDKFDDRCKFSIQPDDSKYGKLRLIAYDGRFLGSDSNGWLVSGKDHVDKSCKFTITGAFSSREIMDVDYDKKKIIIRETSPLIALRAEVKNPSTSIESKQTLTYTYTKSEVGTWNNTVGVELGARIEFEAGIPLLAKNKAEVSFKASYSREWGGSKSTETSVTSSTEITVPAGKKGTVFVTINQAYMDLPFTYKERLIYDDGEVEEKEGKSGVYHNLESYSVSSEIENLVNISDQTKEHKALIIETPKK